MAEATAMQFCRSCNNMLYPREDRETKKLMHVCRRCFYEQEADSPVVYRHELVKSVVNQLEQISTEVVTDPALTRPAGLPCPRCHATGCVMIQAKPTPVDEQIKLMLVCANPDCLHKWQA